MIYICIPTHNEQQTVGVVLWKLRQVLTDFPRDYQLLVADDASSDKTPEVLEPYTRVLPLTVIRSDRQLGYAASLEMLLREAVRRSEYPKRDVIVTLQADFSEEPDDLVPLIKRIEAGADVAVGNKVSKSRPSRMRRFSRSLAGFFARGQKWPEGVETPFDGYRAYRLHALKHAMGERPGRLVRYDGWAAHAELLRHVLPHARRVDVLDVVDRSDRLQRVSRERPIAAALAVRAMSRDADPPGLIPVAELDGIVATASSSRERANLAQSVARNGQQAAARHGNGARTRERSPAGGSRASQQEGGRDRNRMRGGRALDATGEAPARRQPRSAGGGQKRAAGAAAAGPKKGTEPRRQRQPAKARAPKGDAKAKPDTEAEATLPVAPGLEASTDTEAPKPKKKRRRRRRGAGSGAASGAAGTAPGAEVGTESGGADGSAETTGTTGASVSPAAESNEAASEPESESGAAGEGTGDAGQGTGERKRRRRGGRRGGRGRRRKTSPDAESGSTDAPAADAGGSDAPSPAADPTAGQAPEVQSGNV